MKPKQFLSLQWKSTIEVCTGLIFHFPLKISFIPLSCLKSHMQRSTWIFQSSFSMILSPSGVEGFSYPVRTHVMLLTLSLQAKARLFPLLSYTTRNQLAFFYLDIYILRLSHESFISPASRTHLSIRNSKHVLCHTCIRSCGNADL